MPHSPLTLILDDRTPDGRPIGYRVWGLPPGSFASITENVHGQWEIFRVTKLPPSQQFQPVRRYATAQDALAGLGRDLEAGL